MLRTLLILLSICVVQSKQNNFPKQIPKQIPKRNIATAQASKPPVIYPTKLRILLDKLAWLESGNNISIVSSAGYLGKYQTRLSTVKALGFNVTQEEYLSDEALQDSVELVFLRYNKRILRSYIKQYEGRMIDSVYVTEAGIIFASHCLGAGSVIKFLSSTGDTNICDGNGISVLQRMHLFTDVDFRL